MGVAGKCRRGRRGGAPGGFQHAGGWRRRTCSTRRPRLRWRKRYRRGSRRRTL